jgi:hypothetical protein
MKYYHNYLQAFSILIILLLTLSIRAQQNTIFNELSPEHSIYKKIAFPQKTSQTDKLNILFKNNLINYNTFQLATDVLQKDSFYYVLSSYGTHPVNPFITKFNKSGKIIWQHIDTSFYNYNFYHRALSMYYSTSAKFVELSSGNLLYMYGFANADTVKKYTRRVPILKIIDTAYNTHKTFVWPDTTDFLPIGGVVADKAGGFTFCGHWGSRTLRWVPPQNGNPGYYLPDTTYLGIVRVDSNLNIVRDNKIIVKHPNLIKASTVYVENIIKSHDGGYIVGGNAFDGGSINGWGSTAAYAVKFDSLLNVKWTLFFPDSTAKSDKPFNITPSHDGTYIYAKGNTTPKGIAYGKFDENGNILWEKYFRKTMDTNGLGGIFIIEDRPWGIIEKSNGDIIFGSRINWNRVIGVVRTDSMGNVKWSRVISTNYGDSLLYYSYVFNMKNPIGEGVLLVGRVHTKGAFLIRTDSLGCTLPNCLDTNLHVSIEEILELQKQKLIIYPNPVHDNLQIAVNNQGEKVEQIVIYDINGREILKENRTGYLINIDVSNFDKGVYIIKVKGSSGNVLSKKFIKN